MEERSQHLLLLEPKVGTQGALIHDQQRFIRKQFVDHRARVQQLCFQGMEKGNRPQAVFILPRERN